MHWTSMCQTVQSTLRAVSPEAQTSLHVLPLLTGVQDFLAESRRQKRDMRPPGLPSHCLLPPLGVGLKSA